MARRRKKVYVTVIQALIDEVAKLNPEQVMIDFEIAAKLAFEQIFPNCIVKGCLFHFSQSLFKKLAPSRVPYVAEKETNFIQLRLFHRQSIISFTNLYQKILNLYQFFPKKKYVDELLDTDEEDKDCHR